MQFIEEFRKRVENIKGKVLVIYHFDIDGCATASILFRILKKKNITCSFFPVTRGFERIVIEKVKSENPDKILVVDYIPSNELLNFLKDYDASIIDHHLHEKRLEILDYITSADFGEENSLSYLTYLLAKIYNIKNIEWLAKVGAFWDKCLEGTEFYYERIYKKEMKDMLPFNLVVSLTQINGSKKMFEIFNASNSFEDALEKTLNLNDYKRAKEIFDQEYRNILFSKKSYLNLKLNIYKIKTKFKHMRIYVDYITYQNDGTFIFILDEEVQYKFSFRTTLDINLSEIINEISKEIPDFSGGGHKKACGGLLKNRNVEDVINEFIKIYKTKIKNNIIEDVTKV